MTVARRRTAVRVVAVATSASPVRGEGGEPRDRPTASVVIATQSVDRMRLLERCVRSVSRGTAVPGQTLVVVDSNPSVRAALAERLGTAATVVASGGAGASEARNTGLRMAAGDIVAYLDDDADPEPGWLDALLAVFAQRPAVVGVGGRILPEYEPGARAVPPELLWLVGCTYRGHRADAGPISRPIGANMSFRSSALSAVGGFPGTFGPTPAPRPGASPRGPATTKTGSNEELALSLALRRRFGEDCLWYCPDARVRHFVPSARLTPRYGITRCWVEGATKADVAARFGGDSMTDDQRYLVGVLLPAVGNRLVSAARARRAAPVVEAFLLTAAALVTASGYLVRTVAHAVSGSRR
jgi:Glycosyl transferase family 2